MRVMLKSKLYGLKVTKINPDYAGSISISHKWMHDTNIIEYEQVHVLDITNGNRFITYAIIGNDDEICVNGAAALLVNISDELIILAYDIVDIYNEPKIINATRFIC
ncbi:MAG: aspartate 1-decarboxylase [bacterium]|nr:aspartate 1-decarboxylase [bacterium]